MEWREDEDVEMQRLQGAAHKLKLISKTSHAISTETVGLLVMHRYKQQRNQANLNKKQTRNDYRPRALELSRATNDTMQNYWRQHEGGLEVAIDDKQ